MMEDEWGRIKGDGKINKNKAAIIESEKKEWQVNRERRREEEKKR